jgi:TPR repeat protein
LLLLLLLVNLLTCSHYLEAAKQHSAEGLYAIGLLYKKERRGDEATMLGGDQGGDSTTTNATTTSTAAIAMKSTDEDFLRDPLKESHGLPVSESDRLPWRLVLPLGKNLAESFRFIRMAADEGVLSILAFIRYFVYFVTRLLSFVRSFFFFIYSLHYFGASPAGHAKAQYSLGLMYQSGSGVEVDFKLVRVYFATLFFILLLFLFHDPVLTL